MKRWIFKTDVIKKRNSNKDGNRQMNLTDIIEIERYFNNIEMRNDGIISNELLRLFVEGSAESDKKLENLVKYMNYLEISIEAHTSEIGRIGDFIRNYERRLSKIKKCLIPFIINNKRSNADVFDLSIVDSEEIVFCPDFLFICGSKYKKIDIDRETVKQDLKNGIHVLGAEMRTYKDLRIESRKENNKCD